MRALLLPLLAAAAGAQPPPSVTDNPLKLAGGALLVAYRAVLSDQQADVCNFNPSCSRFAGAAVARYGLFGVLMASDRLVRDNPTAFTRADGSYTKLGGKAHDRLEDYWLFSRRPLDARTLYLK